MDKVKSKLANSAFLIYIRQKIFAVVDFFYPPFKKLLPLKTFRYGACGASVALLNLIIFWFSINYVVDKNTKIDFGFFKMTPYIASFIIALLISFPIGFILNKYIVFQGSLLRGRIQLFRYAVMTAMNIFLNYVMLHFFIGFLGFWPTPSQATTTVILAVISYFGQNHFTFGKHKPEQMY